MDEARVHSTPISAREDSKTENWLREIMGEIKLMSIDNSKKFDALNDRFDTKFNEQNSKFDKLSSEIHEQKIKCESNFNELKKQNNELKK